MREDYPMTKDAILVFFRITLTAARKVRLDVPLPEQSAGTQLMNHSRWSKLIWYGNGLVPKLELQRP